MSVVCPKCASPDALSLSLIHREGVPGMWASAGRAAPPTRRNVTGWTILVLACGVLFLYSLRRFDAATVLYAAVVVVGAWIARSNRVFNATRFPQLYNQWQLSFRCTQCGAEFIAS